MIAASKAKEQGKQGLCMVSGLQDDVCVVRWERRVQTGEKRDIRSIFSVRVPFCNAVQPQMRLFFRVALLSQERVHQTD